jgi:hypothetical protein
MQIPPRSALSGSFFEIGQELGRLSKTVLGKCLSDPAYKQQASAWKNTYPIADLMETATRHFPDCWEELRGISDGSEISLDDIYLWNCRPDLVKTKYDSSTSVAVNRLANRFIVHEEVDDPALRPYCHIVDVRPHQRPGFLALYMPGLLPGSLFSTSRAGLVQSVDLLHTPVLSTGVPSAMIARSVLQCDSLLEAMELLMTVPRMGGAHHILAWAGEFVMLSIEATGQKTSVMPISNKYAHTNHLIHSEQANGSQIPNLSSRNRYSALLDQLKSFSDYPEEADILAWLKKGPISSPSSNEAISNSEMPSPGITVFFRCISSNISLQIFNPDRTDMQKFSFAVDHCATPP